MLAGGLSNRDDVRALEELALEFEERAETLRLATQAGLANHNSGLSALRITRS